MKTATINIKQIPTMEFRFDPSLHLSEGVKVREILSELPYEVKPLSAVTANIFLGNIFSRIWVKDKQHGVPYLAASDTVLANLDTGQFLAKKQAIDMPQLVLQKGWTLVTCSGTLGNTSYTNANYAGRIATHDLIRVMPDEKKLPGGYVYAFLSSKYGYFQITQSQFGGVVKHINAAQAGLIQIPILPQHIVENIDNKIKESARLREEAADALAKAVRLLDDTFHVDVHLQKFVTAKANIKEVFKSLQNRLDPPAIMNSGVQSIAQIRSNFDWLPLGETGAQVRRPGIFKRIYVEDGLPYIKGSEIFNINPFMRCEHLSRSRTPFIDEMQLFEGQILVTCAGSIGQVKMITKEYEDNKAIGSQDIIRIETKDDLFTKEYLFAYLQLPYVFEYMQSMKYGSVIERVEPFHIASIPVIKPTKELSQSITSIIKAYMDCMYSAFIFEDSGIKLVESEIEKWSK